MQNQRISLPIDHYLEEITSSLEESKRILLKASPGSGKTTRIPWYLAQKNSKKVLVLEPRRIAAKLAAQRIAEENDLRIGQEIGYRFRYENEMTPETQLIFYTEGTFLKTLQSISFTDIGVVILDEFHERHIESDLALAALIDAQKNHPELKIILMSATLDMSLKDYLGDCKIIEIEHRRFNIDIDYLPNIPSILNQPLARKISLTIEKINSEDDILIFLPGMREINEVSHYLGGKFGVTLILHGDLSKEEQSLVFEKSSSRKIILSTNIAESSVTIPGIKVVIDSGIQRESIFDTWSGLKQLQDRPTTQDSAIQRAGRAGREADGKCFRLYSKIDFENRSIFAPPAILKDDLLEAYLHSLELGIKASLPTPAPESNWNKAVVLAEILGLAKNQSITSNGQLATRFPTQLRLGNILFHAQNLTKSAQEKLLQFLGEHFETENQGQWEKQIRKLLKKSGDEENWQKIMLHGFIDQVSKFRKDHHDFIHYSGKIIKSSPHLKDLEEGLYLILAVSRKEEAQIVFPLDEEWLYSYEPFPLVEESKLILEAEYLKLRRTIAVGKIVLEEDLSQKTWNELSSEEKNKAISVGLKSFEDHLEHFKGSTLFKKFVLYQKQNPQEELSDKFDIEDYFSNNQKLSFHQVSSYFEAKLAEYNLNFLFPNEIIGKNKKVFQIHYEDQIYISAFIQDFYGLEDTPHLNNTPLSLRILGPHKRPIQITSNLKGFWEKGYKEMLKEFKREYPRHHWPEEPSKARPVLLNRQLT